ncbi:hypothetical protein [Modestobacter sp. SYSU DS0875]
MAEAQLEREGVSVILLGSFNPKIFQPSWLAMHDLISEDALEGASIELITNEVSIFSLGWCDLEVLSDRLTLTSSATPSFESLRDLLAGAMRILSHTPVFAVGINMHAHISVSSEAAWHKFGHTLAPKEGIWDFLESPGMLTVAIRSERTDQHRGSFNVKVEPSRRFNQAIFVESNDEFRADSDTPSAQWAVEVLLNDWELSMSRALETRTQLSDLVRKAD